MRMSCEYPIAFAEVASVEKVLKPTKLKRVRGSAPAPRPPIVELIRMSKSIEGLGRIRGALSYGALRGTIDPSEKTERAWERMFWRRVLEIMLTTKRPCLVYNDVLRWGKPAWAAEAIQIAFEAQCKSLPSPADELRAKGITIEGVTT